ncbi:hypothetical protein [Acinetobacter pittii]|uniref:hypothetical protein n=1 Tax=Acinetobacter pittii TaxID=48296 RepID=UPI001D18724D|nr:hypothetical protein [Acinetobacter pittii]MDX8221283.1 hypothetical protein [Acinetobacter pittii]WPP74080.1 hypothetical protein SOI73_02955 [Acinetobacter pittii]
MAVPDKDALIGPTVTEAQFKTNLGAIVDFIKPIEAQSPTYPTTALLTASRPSESQSYAKALDTGKVWYWNKPAGASDGNYWTVTNLSDLDQAKDYADGKYGRLLDDIIYDSRGTKSISQKDYQAASNFSTTIDARLLKVFESSANPLVNQYQFNKAGEKLNLSFLTDQASLLIKKLTPGFEKRYLNFVVNDRFDSHTIDMIEGEQINNNIIVSPYIQSTLVITNVANIVINNNVTYNTVLLKMPPFFSTAQLQQSAARLIYDRQRIFYPATNVDILTVSERAVNFNVSTNTVTFAIPHADITSAGFQIEAKSILEYFAKTYNNYVFDLKTALNYTKQVPAILLTGDASITTNDLCNFNGEVNSKSQSLTDKSYTRYETVVKNNLSVAVTSRPVFIKMKFNPGEVFSDKYIRVLDESGAEYECQWIADVDFNQRRNKNYCYHADGSLFCGRLVIIDSIAAKSSKKYTVQVFKCKVREYDISRLSYTNTSDGVNVTTERGDILNLSKTTGYLINSITTSAITYTGVEQNLLIRNNNGAEQYFSAGYADASFRVVSEGLLFTEIESISYNAVSQTYPEINQKFLKYTTRMRIYKNGLITVKKHVQCALELPTNTVYGVVSRVQLTTSASKTQRAGYNVICPDLKHSFSAIFASADVMRDPLEANYIGAKNPLCNITANSSYIRCDIGWKTANFTIAKLPDVKGWAWTHAFEINLNEVQTDSTVLADIVLNTLVGFASSNPSYSPVRKSEIMTQLGDLISGLADWYQYQATTDDKGGGIINALAAKVVKHLHKGVSSFDRLYTEFSDWATTYYGGVDQIFIGPDAEYKALQFVSRNVSPVVWGLYQLALRHDDQVKADALKAVVSRLSSQAYSGLIEVTTPVNSNFYAAGFRLWAMAVQMGLDTTGKYASALTMLDGKYSSRSNFATTQNIITDNELQNIITARYLHYQVYAANNYLIGCNIANRQPTFDLSSFVLDSIHSYGGISEIDFCIAETRRNGPSTVAFIFHILMQDYDTSKLEAASRLLNAFNEYLSNVRGNQYKLWDAYSHINISTSFSDVLFAANIFADTFIIEYFSQ